MGGIPSSNRSDEQIKKGGGGCFVQHPPFSDLPDNSKLVVDEALDDAGVPSWTTENACWRWKLSLTDVLVQRFWVHAKKLGNLLATQKFVEFDLLCFRVHHLLLIGFSISTSNVDVICAVIPSSGACQNKACRSSLNERKPVRTVPFTRASAGRFSMSFHVSWLSGRTIATASGE